MEILRREHHLTTQEAIARSVDLCDRLTHRFARLRDQVMPRASGPLRAYLGHLTHLTPGNLDWGLRADLVPSGEQSAAGLLADWPEYDEQLDPINRVFLPRADIATENLVAGLIDLGWECDDVTAYRTVRAAPPPAPTRDAIKTGKFDAVVFTSS